MVYDIRSYRIPNCLTLTGAVCGLAYSVGTSGWQGLGASAAGLLFPMILLFGLYALRVLGAGDIKLFAVIGGTIGLSVWRVMLYSFIVGGVMAAFRMLYHHTLTSRMKWFWSYIQGWFLTRRPAPYTSGFEDGGRKNVIHFSIAILIGYSGWLAEGQAWY